MAQQALVIGLGQFGMSVVQSLMEHKVEVLAVDCKTSLVELAANIATDALEIDATDEAALAALNPGERDVVVCAIGDDSRESSIICTALLRQFGVSRLIARACDELHGRILHLVGAHVVVNPEREFGKRFVNRLLHERILSEMPLAGDLQLAEVLLPKSFIGHTLCELELPRRFNATVVALRLSSDQTPHQAQPEEKLLADSVLLVVAPAADLVRLSKEK